MSKAFIAAGAFILSIAAVTSASAHSGDPCLQQMAAAALRVDAEVDTNAQGVVVVRHPSAAPLQPLLNQLGTCLAQVLPGQTDQADEKGGPPQHIWYRSDTQEFCRSANTVGTVGGTSAKKDYRSVAVTCGTTKKP